MVVLLAEIHCKPGVLGRDMVLLFLFDAHSFELLLYDHIVILLIVVFSRLLLRHFL